MTQGMRALIGFTAVGWLAAAPVHAAGPEEARATVERARVSLQEMVDDKYYAYLRRDLHHARGVLIFPQVLKAGFFLGGSGGTGVLLVRSGDHWSEPAFYTMGAVSFGLQIGGEAAEVVMLVNSERGVRSLYESSVKLGGDFSVAAGPVGGGAQGTVTPTLNADFVSFARARGAYAGLNLEGSLLKVRVNLNSAVYGEGATPEAILAGKVPPNVDSTALRQLLEQLGRVAD